MTFEKLRKRWKDERFKRQDEAEKRRNVLQAKGVEVFKKYNISKAVLFGSVSDRSCGSGSDIDLYVHPLSAAMFWVFRRELEEATGYSIDLYTDSDDKIFVEKILTRGEAVYEK